MWERESRDSGGGVGARARTKQGASYADSSVRFPHSPLSLWSSPTLSPLTLPLPLTPRPSLLASLVLGSSSSARVRLAIKLASPRVTVTQPRGYPAVGLLASTSRSPPSWALKTPSLLLAQHPVAFIPRSPIYRRPSPALPQNASRRGWL